MRLRRFQVQGFKSFRRPVALEDLGGVNVIHGDNNAGKSNLIEAIGLYFALIEELFEVPLAAERMRASDEGSALLARLLESTVERSPAPPPLQPKRELIPALLEKRGYPARDIFHLREPAPIELAGSFALAPGELEAAGIELPAALSGVEVERVDVTVRLRRVLAVLEVDLVTFATGAAVDPQPLTFDAPGHATFLRRLGSFLCTTEGSGASRLGRRFALVEADRWIEGARDWSHAGRDMIPPDLCMALYEARESREDTRHQRLRSFVVAMQRFEDILGPGQFVPVYDRRSDRASLVFETADEHRIPAHLLGTGIQQVASLVGRMVITGATILAMEEPELNLRYTRQLLLRDVLFELVGTGGAPSQVFLTSHSPAFESATGFYAVRDTADGPVVDKRPSDEAARFTGSEPMLIPPAGERAPLCWISSEGLVQVPEEIRAQLGLQGGGGVYFIERKDTGHVEMLTDEQFLALFEDSDRER